MKRFSPSGQHYPDPSKPPPEDGIPDNNNLTDQGESKKVKTSQSFESLFDNETLSDIIINVNDGQFMFNGHKMILGMKSDILASMLNELGPSEMEDKPVLYLHESTECSLVFSRFLYFIYSGAVWLHRDYVLELHKLAKKYDVKPLEQHCDNYVTQILQNMLGMNDSLRGFPVETVCDLYECNTFSEEIRQLSYRVLCAKFKDLACSERWPHCTWHLVCDLLKCDDCHAEENVILTSATDWMKKNNLSDKNLIEDILVNIRYPLLHRRVLYHLQKNKAFKNFPQVQELVEKAVHYHCFKDLPEAKHEFVGVQYRKRNFRNHSTSSSAAASRSNSDEHLQQNGMVTPERPPPLQAVHYQSPNHYVNEIVQNPGSLPFNEFGGLPNVVPTSALVANEIVQPGNVTVHSSDLIHPSINSGITTHTRSSGNQSNTVSVIFPQRPVSSDFIRNSNSPQNIINNTQTF